MQKSRKMKRLRRDCSWESVQSNGKKRKDHWRNLINGWEKGRWNGGGGVLCVCMTSCCCIVYEVNVSAFFALFFGFIQRFLFLFFHQINNFFFIYNGPHGYRNIIPHILLTMDSSPLPTQFFKTPKINFSKTKILPLKFHKDRKSVV